MKKYNTPEIETLALEMIDVITASIPGGDETGTVQDQLKNSGLSDDQITKVEESIGTMQVDSWGW